MKIRLSILLGFCLAALLHAQAPVPDPVSDYAPEDLDQLLAPIALYPDALIALILPASTEPSDVVLAARYLEANGDPAQVDSQPWDDSVKALAHYPDVIKWMDANLEWTKGVGAAFLQQPADVMKSIQQLRAQARAAGTLVDTPQQQVVMEDDNICIVPAQPDAIYVPEYDSDAVYAQPAADPGPLLTFGAEFPVGAWLGFYACDWSGYGIRVGVWKNWRRPDFNGHAGQHWRPNPARVREFRQGFDRARPGIPRPRPMPGTPVIPHRADQKFTPAVRGGNSRPDVRGWDSTARPAPNQARPAAIELKPPAPQGQLFGGYNRGSVTRDFSNRGQQSRQSMKPPSSQPARQEPGRPAAAPARSQPPSGSHDNKPQH
ncbi:MAG TPA: DUF3300 domain-containing protein [Opitutaceae bacterium]|jgi:hypothetical protein|nr:DUF3300 domain-containing protein [Opitutaceae bacterium]